MAMAVPAAPAPSLADVLLQTLSPDNAARRAAEALLHAAEDRAGFPSALLALLGEARAELAPAHLAAALALKRCCMHRWNVTDLRAMRALREAAAARGERAPEGASPYAAEEKAALRARFVRAAASAHLASAPLQNALSDAFRFVAREDFPDRWPELPAQLLAELTSRDAGRTVAALRMLHMVFYSYGATCPESQPGSPPDMLASACMPTVLALAGALVDGHGSAGSGGLLDAPEAAKALSLALKCMRHLTQFNIYKIDYACREETVLAWCGLADRLLRRPLPPVGRGPHAQPEDEEARAKWPWWNAKKWAVRLLVCLSYLRKDMGAHDAAASQAGQLPPQAAAVRARLPGVVELFRGQLAPRHAETLLGMLIAAHPSPPAAADRAAWLSPKVQLHALKFLQQAAEFGSVWRPLRPHLPQLVSGVLVGVLRLSPADAREFEEEPLAWVQRQADPFAAFVDPRAAAENLLHGLTTLRKRAVMPVLDALVAQTLTAYAALPAGSPLRDHAGKEAVLRVLALLNRVWRRSRAHNAQLEGLLELHVLPELASGLGAMRARAVHTLSVFADSKSISRASKARALAGVLGCLRDASPPVRVGAARALQSYLHAAPEVAREVMAPHVVGVITVLLGMLEELGMDSVVEAITALVSCFDDQLAQLAPPLAAKMADVFAQLMRASRANELDGDDEGGGSGAGAGSGSGGGGFEELDEDDVDQTIEAVLLLLHTVVELLTQKAAQGEAAAGAALEAGVLPHVWAALASVFDPEAQSLEYIPSGVDLFVAAVEGIGAEARSRPPAGGAAAGSAEWDADVALLSCAPAWHVFSRLLRTFEERAVDYSKEVGLIAMEFIAACGAGGARAGAPGGRLAAPPPGHEDVAELVLRCGQACERSGDDEARLNFAKCFVLPLLHYGRGHVDRVLPRLAELYAPAPAGARTAGARKAAALALAMCLQYSPSVALDALAREPSGRALESLLDLCLELGRPPAPEGAREGGGQGENGDEGEDEDGDEDDSDRNAATAVESKVILLGLASLLGAAASAATAAGSGELGSVGAQLPKAVGALLQLLAREEVLLARAAREDAEAEAKGDAEDADEEDEEDEGRRGGGDAGSVEDDGDDGDDDGSVDGGNADGGVGGFGSEIEDDDDDGRGVNSPLDHVSSLLFADEALRALAACAPLAPRLQAALPPAALAAVAQLMAAAGAERSAGKVTGALGPEPA